MFLNGRNFAEKRDGMTGNERQSALATKQADKSCKKQGTRATRPLVSLQVDS
jgi:hypothetical protein